MQIMEMNAWADFKSLATTKALLIQYSDRGDYYDVYAPEASTFLWRITIPKDGGSDVTDFETNIKPTANSPLENKAGIGRPERVAASPQPNNTVEHWKGYQIVLASGNASAYVDVEFATDVYLKGGNIISIDVDSDDYVQVDALVKANNYVYLPKLIDTAYLQAGHVLSFLSDECMLFPVTLKLRITLNCPAADKNITANVLVDYFI